MVRYYKNADNKLIEASAAEPGTWVNMINPTEEELNHGEEQMTLFHHAALDEEETSHIDCEENQTLIIIDVPIAETGEKNNVVFATLPVGIIVTTDNVVTVSLKETSAFREIAEGKVKNVFPVQKTKFVLQVLLRVAKRYLYYLKQIDKISHFVEKQLHKSMKNKELFQLLELEKSLVYFSTSLQSDSITIKKILMEGLKALRRPDLLDDVLTKLTKR